MRTSSPPHVDASPLGPPPAEPTLDPAELAAMQAALEERIEAERGLRAWLRSRPTPVRRLVLALPIAGLALFGGLGAGSRAGALGLGLVGALLAAVSLRPIQLPAWPRAVRLALPFLALAFVAGFSAFGGAGPTELGAHLRCFAPGMGIAAAVLGLWWACAREPLGWAGLAGASAAGVAANAFLAGRCAMGGAQHLLLGHASVLLLVLVLTAAVLAFARR